MSKTKLKVGDYVEIVIDKSDERAYLNNVQGTISKIERGKYVISVYDRCYLIKKQNLKLLNKIETLLYLFKQNIMKNEKDSFSESDRSKNSIDWALLVMLTRHIDVLPELDEYFHKAFRQCDVIRGDDGCSDVVIWHLLNASETFWKIFEQVIKKNNE